MKAIDWLARTAMLVLAALATLSLVGSLASVSNSAIGDAFPGQIAAPAGSATEPAPASAASAPRVVDPGTGTMVIEAPGAAPPPDDEAAVERWLKALTYAVLALAIVAAAGVVALVRIAGQLSRIAER